MSVMICIGMTPLIWSVYLYVLCPRIGTLPRNPPHYGGRKLLQLAHPDVQAYYRNLEEDQASSRNVDAPDSAISQRVLLLFVGDSDSPSHKQGGTDNTAGQGSSAVQGRAGQGGTDNKLKKKLALTIAIGDAPPPPPPALARQDCKQLKQN